MWDGEQSILCHVCLLMMKDDESALTWTVCVLIWVVWYLVLKSLSPPFFLAVRAVFWICIFFKFQIYRQVHLVFSESAVSDSTTKSTRNCLCCEATLKHGKWVMCLDFVQENRLCQPYERNANITSCTFSFYVHFFFIVHARNWKNMNNRK